MDTSAVAIFVKTPGYSPLKTRLAASIGEKKTMEFYALCLQALEATCRECSVEFYWAVAEQEAIGERRWSALPVIAQGEGALGQRLYRVERELRQRHSRVALIGADCPQITAQQIGDALAMLTPERPSVFGPARDGGFYLYAGLSALPLGSWESVRYSTEYALEDLKAHCASSLLL
ncbi:MAG: TIGR04282 family arsenosugar biosynthesis glycosyltransferase, partial [Bdellovibrionota bacterium]